MGLLTSCEDSDLSTATSGITFYKDTTHQFATTLVKNSIEETVLTVSNTSSASIQVAAPGLTGNADFTLVSDKSCGSQLAANSSCPLVVRFTPSSPQEPNATLSIAEPNASSTEDRIKLVGQAYGLPGGKVTSTANPLVAEYTINPGVDAAVSVDFGLSTSYGLQTWLQPSSNGSVSIFVAGMRQNTRYHMRASVQLPNGNVLQDSDRTFTTTTFPSAIAMPSVIATTMNGTPQPGIELVAATAAPTDSYLEAYALDLQGNIIWGYTYPGQASALVQPIKLLGNGHFLLIASFASQNVFGPEAQGGAVTLREIDLTGATIREVTLQDLNKRLLAAGHNVSLTDFHHDVTILPNGHFLLLANTAKEYDNLEGYPGPNQILADVIVDLDANFNPVWVWNEFDYLDVNRHPLGLPDWTHTNAVLYSKDDGNILVSSRHQSWIMKVDYQNGAGSGEILWKLGRGGDFTLVNGTDPTDWFYAQHQADFVSPNTTGVFTLSMMDNGLGRAFPSTVNCNTPGEPDCLYSRAPIIRVDETAKTATLVYANQQPSSEYSVWGGGTTALGNGNLEFDLCNEPNFSSIVREIIPGVTPTLVWQLNITGGNAYRANRIQSLYPGVQW